MVKVQNRENKYRKQREGQIREGVEGELGVAGVRREVQEGRIKLATMKSQYNIKIKKIDNEIKDLKAKNKEL